MLRHDHDRPDGGIAGVESEDSYGFHGAAITTEGAC